MFHSVIIQQEMGKDNMRIALIRKNYSPYGGAENYLSLVYRGLQAQGNEVHIFSADRWLGGFQVCKVRTIKKPSFLSNVSFALNVKRILKKESFDCILSFERLLYQDIYRAGDGCHREWLMRRRAVEPFYKRMSFSLNPHHIILLYLERQCLLNSKIIIANSIMVKRDIIRHYNVPQDKIHVIYNGVDLDRFRPVDAEQKNIAKDSLGIKGYKVILFVGADFKRKGLLTLFRALSLLNMKDKRLIVAGRKETPEYLMIAKKLGIDKDVTFRGPERSIERLYTAADVFILPTIYDPFSNATLEAMASGLPVITTKNNGASELIENGQEGFVMDDPLNAEALAQRILVSLKDEEAMGKNARQKAENFSIEKAAIELIEIIKLAHN